MDLEIAVIMPDHVHLIFTPLVEQGMRKVNSVADILARVKSPSAHQINKLLGRSGKVWREESFDHVIRSSESLEEKIDYVRRNPMRRGLADVPEDYLWLWEKRRVR